MRKSEYINYKKHILEYVEPADFIADVEAYHGRNYKAPTIWAACRQMVLDGFFACYYSQVLDALADIYGDEYDDTKYLCKNGDLRYKSGQPYCWTIYADKMATAGAKLYEELKNKA